MHFFSITSDLKLLASAASITVSPASGKPSWGWFGSKRVFQIVRELAQLFISTCGGVDLERVHSATHAAHDLGVVRTTFELQTFFVERLQKLLRALKEEFLQLGRSFFRKKTHCYTSIRWYAVPLFRWIILNLSLSPKRLSAWPMNK